MYPGVANLLLMCWFYIVFFKNSYMFVFRFTNPSKKDYLKIRLFCHLSSYFISFSLYSGLIVKDRIIWFYSMPVSVSLELFQKTVLLLHVGVTIFVSIDCFDNIRRTLCKLVDYVDLNSSFSIECQRQKNVINDSSKSFSQYWSNILACYWGQSCHDIRPRDFWDAWWCCPKGTSVQVTTAYVCSTLYGCSWGQGMHSCHVLIPH